MPKKNLKKKSKKKKLLIDFMTSVIDSRILVTTHREIAAWTITAFYLTGLFVGTRSLHKTINYIFDVSHWLQWVILLFIIITISSLCVAVFVFIHAQYGSHRSNRQQYEIYKKVIFKLISDYPLKEKDLKIKDNNSESKIVREEKKKLDNKDTHKWSEVNPLIIYLWSIDRIFKTEKARYKDFKKLYLVESSLYNLVFVPTFIVIVVIIFDYFKIVVI